MTDPHTEVARKTYDPRVRYEIRPALDSDENEYEIIMTTSRGTDSFRVSYELGGALLDAFRERLEEITDE